MKRIFKSLVALILIAFFISSCSKDKIDSEEFSEKSVEENKAVVENSAIEMAKSMDDMKNLEAVDVAVSLGERLDMDDPFEDKFQKATKVAATVKVIAGLQAGNSGSHEVFSVMKSNGELEDDPESIEEVWDEVVGVYAWNSSLEMWEYTTGSDKVIFQFPSRSDGLTNNAELTISDYSGVQMGNPLDDDYSGDLPVSLKMEVKVGETTLISQTFTAKYNSDGIPESIEADLTIEDFKFEVDITNNDKEVSANYKLSQGTQVIINAGVSALGDFTDENIENSTVTEDDEWEELDVGEVINTANARFQLYNIALRGEADIKALIDKMDELYPDDYWNDPDWDEEEVAIQEAAAYNEHMLLYAVDLEENTRIAEAEAYVVQDNNDWGDNYWVDFRLTFGDGSSVDMETYFESGFNDFVDEINSIIRELNGDYNLDLDLIDY